LEAKDAISLLNELTGGVYFEGLVTLGLITGNLRLEVNNSRGKLRITGR
jgi:hypothetical protein